jgi:hypothetical protein
MLLIVNGYLIQPYKYLIFGIKILCRAIHRVHIYIYILLCCPLFYCLYYNMLINVCEQFCVVCFMKSWCVLGTLCICLSVHLRIHFQAPALLTLILYFSILLHWLIIQFTGAVLEVQHLVMFVDWWCATSSCNIVVSSTACFNLIRSSLGRWFKQFLHCIVLSSLF